MNLDANDLELIKQTVRAAVSEATSDLATKAELREFRDEVRATTVTFYPREMIDRFREEGESAHRGMAARIEKLEKELADQRDIFARLWEHTGVKVGIAFGVVLQAFELWQFLQK